MFLSDPEVARLLEALYTAEEAKTASPWAIAAVRLPLYTGARLNEILTLRWEWVDWQRRLLLLPISKTGPKSIVLSGRAVAVLGRIPRIEGNPYVICGKRPGAHLVNLQKPWRRIRKAAGLDHICIHDLRHSFASFAAAGGASLPMIGALLGHSEPRTTARYAHLANGPLAQVAEAVGQQIEGARSLSRA
jgi:integrase